jgi:hypothetical protein
LNPGQHPISARLAPASRAINRNQDFYPWQFQNQESGKMNLWGGMILTSGITWGIVAILLAILGAALAPILPQIDGLTLGSFALLMAGIHYVAKAHSDFLRAMIGGGLAGIVAALFLMLIRYVPFLSLPTPPGTPADLVTALLVGFVAGAAGGMAYKLIIR